MVKISVVVDATCRSSSRIPTRPLILACGFGTIVGEPFAIHKTLQGSEREDRIVELLKIVGLDSGAMSRYPHEFSGGQRQRIGIARALALNPKLIVADEPVSALDVSIQAQITDLLSELQRKFGLAYLFISHSIPVVEQLSRRIGVMYLGKLVEVGTAEQICWSPKHPYTQALISAVPVPDPAIRKERIILGGDVPTPINPPSAAAFIRDARSPSSVAGLRNPCCGLSRMGKLWLATSHHEV